VAKYPLVYRLPRNGEITIHAIADPDWITVKVRDSGSGIHPELLPRILERGVSDSGTGLGLSICKTAVEAHGGTIAVESEYGQYTEITITLPIYAPPDKDVG